MKQQGKVLDDEPALAGSLPFLSGRGLNLPPLNVFQSGDTSFLVTIPTFPFPLVPRSPAPGLKEN
jgi:hypothetical protein